MAERRLRYVLVRKWHTVRTPNSAVSICLYISNIKYISSDLQLGKLKENVLATQAFANPENISEPQTGIEPVNQKVAGSIPIWGSEIFSGFVKAWVAKKYSLTCCVAYFHQNHLYLPWLKQVVLTSKKLEKNNIY